MDTGPDRRRARPALDALVTVKMASDVTTDGAELTGYAANNLSVRPLTSSPCIGPPCSQDGAKHEVLGFWLAGVVSLWSTQTDPEGPTSSSTNRASGGRLLHYSGHTYRPGKRATWRLHGRHMDCVRLGKGVKRQLQVPTSAYTRRPTPPTSIVRILSVRSGS